MNPTHMLCPKAANEATHHLIPKSDGRIICTYCNKSRTQIMVDAKAVLNQMRIDLTYGRTIFEQCLDLQRLREKLTAGPAISTDLLNINKEGK